MARQPGSSNPAPGQYETVAIPKRLQLVASPGYRFNDFRTDSQLVNCFAEKDLNDGEYWIGKRPCFSNELLSPASSGINPARGLYRYQGYSGASNAYIFLVAKNARLSSLNQSVTTTTLIGNISASQANYTFETIRTSPNYTVVMNDGSLAYHVSSVSVTDMNTYANFPTNLVRGWAYLDGTLYVMTATNQIFGSGLDDPTSWSALNVIIARNGSDRSVALAKHKQYVAALKESSTEFFYNAGNPAGSPLSSLIGTKIPYGCANSYTVQSIDDELLWLSRGEGGIYQIIRLTNLRPSVVSTPAIERILRNFTGFVGGNVLLVYSFQLKLGGHRYYGVSIPFTAGSYITGGAFSGFVTLVYDLDQNLWYRWTSAGSDTEWEVAGTAGPDDTNRVIMQNYSTGNIHSVSEDYIQTSDAGVVPPVDIYTVAHDFGTQRNKTLAAMFFKGNKIPGAMLQIRHSDDDFQSWSNFRDVNLNDSRPMLTDCGEFFRRAWNLHNRTPTPFRLKTTDLQLDIGTL